MKRSMDAFSAQITFLKTKALKDTTWFYEKILGLPLALDQGVCKIYRVSGNAYIGFCVGETEIDPENVILTLVTDDVDGWYERLVNRGVIFDKIPEYNPQYDIYHCFLRDPNGYLIEIQRFDDPRWKP